MAKRILVIDDDYLVVKTIGKLLEIEGYSVIISEGGKEALLIIEKEEIDLIINTPSGGKGQSDAKHMRNLATMQGIPCITTIQGAQAAVNGMESVRESDFSVTSIQEYLQKCS